MFSLTPTAAEARPSNSEHLVYVLDDEPEICTLMTRMLTSMGFSAQSFSELTEFELALARKAPQTIILDLTLRKSDAVETIRSLSTKQVGAAILLMSGNHHSETIDQVRNIGARNGLIMLPFLKKPISMEELQTRLTTSMSLCSSEPDGIDLACGLRKNLLELWYQPKVDLKSNTISGAEALIRLRSPRGLIYIPERFLPSTSDPLHTALADFVIRRVFTDWSDFAANNLPIKLAVNIPLSVFEDREFVSHIRKYIPSHPRFPGLIIELTEHDVVRDQDFAREIATQLKLYNIHLAIDDFGTGYSTAQRLAELPFAELKIDRSLVNGCSGDLQRLELCRRYVILAHRMNMTAVAEGVETTDDLTALIDMNCDTAQGFYFSPPIDTDDFTSALLSHRPITASNTMYRSPPQTYQPSRQHEGNHLQAVEKNGREFRFTPSRNTPGKGR